MKKKLKILILTVSVCVTSFHLSDIGPIMNKKATFYVKAFNKYI